MSLKQLGGETVIYGLANILPRLLNFVVLVPFLTNVMVSEDYGVAGDLFFFIAIFIALLTFRMDTVVFRYASRKEYDARAVFRKAQGFVVAAVTIVIGAGLLSVGRVAEWMSYPDRDVYVLLFLLTVAFDCLSAVPQARLRLERRAWFFVAVNLGNTILNLILTFLFLYFWPKWGSLFGLEYRPELQVVYYMSSIAIAAGFRYLLLLADGVWRYRNRKTDWKNSPGYGTLLAYSAPLTLVAVAGVYNAQSGLTIIKEFFGNDTTGNFYWTGQFSAALKLAVILNLFVTAFNYAAEPFFFRQTGTDLATADRTIYADATRAYAIVGALVCASIMLFLPWIRDFIGRDLQEGLFVLPFILAGNFFLGLYSNFSIAYKLTDKTYLGGAIALVGSVICAAVGIGFIGEYGILAPAAAMLACYFVMCVLAWAMTRRVFPVDYPIGRITLYVLLSSLTVFGALSLDAGLVGRVALFILLLGAFVGMEWRWGRGVLGI